MGIQRGLCPLVKLLGYAPTHLALIKMYQLFFAFHVSIKKVDMPPAKFTANVACLGNGLTGCFPAHGRHLLYFSMIPNFVQQYSTHQELL